MFTGHYYYQFYHVSFAPLLEADHSQYACGFIYLPAKCSTIPLDSLTISEESNLL